ncbi:MAG: hypothetical protein QM765_13680 [Myxococcales bacterium]
MTSRFALRLGLALTAGLMVVVAGCGDASSPVKPVGNDIPDSVEPPADTVDYNDLQRRYGEPNANLVLNPRSFDVYTTSSRDTVVVADDTLTFTGADAAWVKSRRPGDTLYCSRECNGVSFVRSVRSVTFNGDTVVVSTFQGRITDVIQYGWLHNEMPIEVVDDPSAQAFYDDEGGGAGGSGPSTGTPGGSDQKESNFSGSMTGKTSVGVKFNVKVTADLVINAGDIWKPKLPYIELFRLKLEGGPRLDFTAEAKAEGKYEKTWTFFSKTGASGIKLGTIPLGPVSIIPTLELEARGTATAEGKVSVKANAYQELKFWVELKYTDANDWKKPVDKGYTREKGASISAEGEASAKVVGEVDVGMYFAIYGVAGPYLTTTGSIGAEVKAKASVYVGTDGRKCAASLDARVFCGLNAKVGAKICVPCFDKCFPETPFETSIYSNEWDLATYHYDVPPEKMLVCSGVKPDGGAPACAAGQTMCRAGCKDLKTDPKNCGTCTNVCTSSTGDANSTCSAGKCSCTCADGSACPNGKNITGCPCAAGKQNCGAGCINVTTDRVNCGACGYNCVNKTGDSNSVCSAGKCSCKCSNGTNCPDGKSTSSCPAPCRCEDGALCPSGTIGSCPCPAGQKRCNGVCKDILGDEENCGGCGARCLILSGGDTSSVCNNGRCDCHCSDGSVCPSNDHSNCCEVGTIKCNGQCTDLQNDRYNCGQCGRECGPYTGESDSVCVAGECSCFCKSDGRKCPDGTWWSCKE